MQQIIIEYMQIEIAVAILIAVNRILLHVARVTCKTDLSICEIEYLMSSGKWPTESIECASVDSQNLRLNGKIVCNLLNGRR